VHEFDGLMMTGLHWACKRGFTDVAAKLLACGADPEAQDIVARTPLYIAISNVRNDIVKVHT
jgi:ankyrin repeat protein